MRIALLGDVAFFGKYSADSNPIVWDHFKLVADYLRQFEYVVGSLETPFVKNGKPHGAKSAYINSDPRNVELLKYLNINVVNLANNHIYDYGAGGYQRTLETLVSEDIKYFGVEDKQVVLDHQDVQVAFHGYCSHNTNPLGISKAGRPGINALNVANVEGRILDNHRRGLLNVVSVHSGFEHVNFPSLDDIYMARKFSEICPYVYYGHHPHVVQGFEVFRGALIAYSLGNFCFDDVYTSKSSEPLIKQSYNNRRGLILELDVAGNSVLRHVLTPIFLGDEGIEVGSRDGASMLSGYSDALDDNDEVYQARRDNLVREYINERKKRRNLTWYLKRVNCKSVEMLLRAKINQQRYRKNVSRFVARGHAGV